MAEHIKLGGLPHDGRPGSLGELIHAAVRRAIEVAVDVELTTALGAPRYARCGSRCGYRNGTKARMLTGPTGPLALTVPRATVVTPTGSREWRSALLPRYHRRLREVKVEEADLPRLAQNCMLDDWTYSNPRPISRSEEVLEILRAAY